MATTMASLQNLQRPPRVPKQQAASQSQMLRQLLPRAGAAKQEPARTVKEMLWGRGTLKPLASAEAISSKLLDQQLEAL